MSHLHAVPSVSRSRTLATATSRPTDATMTLDHISDLSVVS